jgi:hypothetical protein
MVTNVMKLFEFRNNRVSKSQGNHHILKNLKVVKKKIVSIISKRTLPVLIFSNFIGKRSLEGLTKRYVDIMICGYFIVRCMSLDIICAHIYCF